MNYKRILFIPAILLCLTNGIAQVKKLNKNNTMSYPTVQEKMIVEIWSDVLCPFCYIGKHNFEKALKEFQNNPNIQVVWKSFQLDPSISDSAKQDYVSYLAERKGLSPNQVKQMIAGVVEMGKTASLEFHFEKAVIANSHTAHRLLHLAAKQGVQNELKEALLTAHFVEGKNIGDSQELLTIAESVKMDSTEVATLISSTQYEEEVKRDIWEARQIGVNGVPFFVFDRKYAVSGAQATETFTKILHKAYDGWQQVQKEKALEVTDGKVCTPEGKCD
jgi:predicted DsbA family dithiol-disulfide isomerase